MTRRRALPLALAVFALLAVVAFVARGRPLWGTGGKGTGLPKAFWDYTVTTLVIAFVASAIVWLAIYWSYLRGGLDAERRGVLSTARSVAILLAICVVLAFIGRHIDFRHLFHPHSPKKPIITPGGGSPPGKRGHGLSGRAPGVTFQWPELFAVLGGLLVLALIVATRSRGLPPASWSGDGGAEQLAAALDESLDDLRTEPDLRRAIVAAYARMERALAAAGFPRRPAEAPREYLERALRELDTSARAVRKLTDLFEWARFSHHEPEPGMRNEAIEALADVRDELRGRSLVPA